MRSMLRYKIITCLLGFFILVSFSVVSAEVPRTLYVINNLARTMSKLNMETGMITHDFLTTGEIPNQIVSFNNMLYVVNSGTDDIMIIDPQDDEQEAGRIALPEGSNPWYMAFVGSRKAYVTNWVASSVSVVDIDNETVLKDIPVGTAPQGILVIENQAYVCNTGGYPNYHPSTVSVIDVLQDSVIQTLDVPANPQDLADAPDGRIHVLCSGNYSDLKGKIAVIDRWAGPNYTPAVVDTVAIGGTPGDIVITPSGNGYCAAYGRDPNGHLYKYDAIADTVIHGADDPIPVGFGAMRLLYDIEKKALWISNFGDDTVQLFEAQSDSVTATYGFGDGAQDMAIVGPILESDPWADIVANFTPGQNWSGFGENFYPQNVLGPPDPDPTLNQYNASNKPEEILSLGHGGEIVLGFIDNQIINGSGPDFTIFENAFISLSDESVFMEAGIVSVSQDQENWFQFPYDTTSMSGLAGVTPTADNQHPTDPSVSGGDQFDLEDVGLEWATYVKITDLGDIYQEGPYSGDFDLDAVVAIHDDPITRVDERVNVYQPASYNLKQNYPNPFNSQTMIAFSLPEKTHVQLTIFNQLGQEVKTLVNDTKEKGTHQVIWNGINSKGRSVHSGIYFYRLKVNEFIRVRKMTLIR